MMHFSAEKSGTGTRLMSNFVNFGGSIFSKVVEYFIMILYTLTRVPLGLPTLLEGLHLEYLLLSQVEKLELDNATSRPTSTAQFPPTKLLPPLCNLAPTPTWQKAENDTNR